MNYRSKLNGWQKNRIFWLKAVVAGGLISGLLLSARLWTGERLFPRIPVFLNLIPASVEPVLFVLLLGLLCVILISPKPQKLIFLALAVIITFAVSDQMRWQPWLYQYFFMLATISFFSWNYSDTEKQQAVLNTSRLIIIGTYFFSGLQKMNSVFMGKIFPWMMQPVARFFPEPSHAALFSIGILIPLMEIAIGLGLLTKKYRKRAIILALLMHTFILFSLGPLGHNYNSVVWPWNIAMPLFVGILFWNAEDFSLRDILWTKNFPFQRFILILFIIMPVFSFFNLWDSYLSSALYSGNTNDAQIYISDTVKERLPPEIGKYVVETPENKNKIDMFTWSLGELNVPPYPETRIYKSIARNFCKYSDMNRSIVFVIDGKQTLLNGDHLSQYDCSDL